MVAVGLLVADTPRLADADVSNVPNAPRQPARLAQMKALVILTDAHGSRGGIAKFNRDLLQALGDHPMLDSIRVLARQYTGEASELPAKLSYEKKASIGKPQFAFSVAREAGS